MIYCVYAHYTPGGELFYIGKGKKKRAYSRHSRNQHWLNIVNKYGFRVKILLDNTDEPTAFSVEQDEIKKAKKLGFCKANYTDGGRGIPGHKHSTKVKNRIAQSQKVRANIPTKNMIDGFKKLSKSKKIQWKTPTVRMLNGIKKRADKMKGRTKDTHEGIARMAEKMKTLSAGKNNPRHKWYWKTPRGIFESSYIAAKELNMNRKTIERWCKSPRKEEWTKIPKEEYENGRSR